MTRLDPARARRRFPDRDRALRHLRRTQAMYRYGRYPQRYILGMDAPDA